MTPMTPTPENEPNGSFNLANDWPDIPADYAGTCKSCGSAYRGGKFRLSYGRCLKCGNAELAPLAASEGGR